MLNRDVIFQRAYDECLTEMYAKAQPSADYHQLIQDVKEGKIVDSDKDPIYARYYLSEAEFKYILNKYIDAYGLNETWTSNIEVLERYFSGEGRKDIYIPEKVDEDGFKHPGYRSSEEVPHIKDSIEGVLADIIPNENICAIAKDISKTIFEYINNCKDYYRFDREEQNFSAGVALGCSPTSNKETVIKYWKERGIDVEIKDRNPLLLWDIDYYEDEFEDVMIDEVGEDWVEVTWNNYFDSNDGKRHLVNAFMNGKSEFNMWVVHYDDGELYVANFANADTKIPIDKFISDNNIDWHNFI